MHRVGSIVLAFSLATHLPAIAWPLPPPRGITIRDLIPLVGWQKQFKITDGTPRLIQKPQLQPALPVLPGDINLSAPIRLQTGYKMYNRETGKLKRAGQLTHFVKQISYSQFDTPAGLINGYYIEIDHRMESTASDAWPWFWFG